MLVRVLDLLMKNSVEEPCKSLVSYQWSETTTMPPIKTQLLATEAIPMHQNPITSRTYHLLQHTQMEFPTNSDSPDTHTLKCIKSTEKVEPYLDQCSLTIQMTTNVSTTHKHSCLGILLRLVQFWNKIKLMVPPTSPTSQLDFG